MSEFFSIITDMNGKLLTAEELQRMNEKHLRLLREKRKRLMEKKIK